MHLPTISNLPTGFEGAIEASEPWLRKLRDIRTDTEHMGKTIVTPLGVATINGKLHKEYPKVENQILASEFVDIVYKNLFCFPCY